MSKLVAVFQIGSLGDSIVSVPTLLSVRELVPGCSEYLLISQFDSKTKVLPMDIFEMAWKPKMLLNYSNPDKGLLNRGSLVALLAKLRYYRPSHCVYLMPSDREPERIRRDRAFFKAAGVKELLGFHSLPPTRSVPAPGLRIEDSEAYLKFERLWGDAAAGKFAKYSQVPLLHPGQESVSRVTEWLKANRTSPNKKLIAVSPYSNYPSRDIPEKTIVDVIKRLTHEAGAEIVMVGGGKDFERAQTVLNHGAAGLNACGVFSVTESAALLQQCSLALCTESGPMHLAATVGTPLLATFSRINKRLAQWLPFGRQINILYREVACAGCVAFECPVEGHPCMTEISADEIICCALSLLRGLPLSESALNGTKLITR